MAGLPPQQTVKLAIDCETGETVSAITLLDLQEVEFTALRRAAMAARNERKKGGHAMRFQCAICKQPLYLSRRIKGSHNRWFSHDGKSENCPWYEGNHLKPEQIKALIYRGQQEGQAHREIKRFISKWLEKDSHVTHISQEQTTFGEILKGEWRRPDVKCLYLDKPVVFEIQLSYIFLSDVIARDEFYRQEGIFIIWVFAEFDQTRAAVNDEAFFNRRNLFVLDSAAMQASITNQMLTFNGYRQVPTSIEGQIQDVWRSEEIRLNEVIFPVKTFRPYFYDYSTERKKIEAAHTAVWQKVQLKNWTLGIQNYLGATSRYYESNYSQEMKPAILAAVDALYENTNWHRGFETLREERFFGWHCVLPVLMTIKHNKPIGYKLKSVYQVIEVGLRGGLREFKRNAFAILYLRAYKTYKPTVNEKNRLWLRRYAHEVKRSVEARERTYMRYEGDDQAIALLFPELELDLDSKFGTDKST
jgi:hypothetical protein